MSTLQTIQSTHQGAYSMGMFSMEDWERESWDRYFKERDGKLMPIRHRQAALEVVITLLNTKIKEQRSDKKIARVLRKIKAEVKQMHDTLESEANRE